MGANLSRMFTTTAPLQVPTAASSDCSFCEEMQEASKSSKEPRLTQRGMVLLASAGLISASLYAVLIPFVLPGFRRICLPYVPATKQQIDNVIHLLKDRRGSCIDLGSGDGRIVREIAQRALSDKSFRITAVHGVELNPWLVLFAKYRALTSRLPKNLVAFQRKDIFLTDLQYYDNIVVFGVEQLMVELELKLETELKQDAAVIACRFPFPNWIPVKEVGEGIDTVWLYNISK